MLIIFKQLSKILFISLFINYNTTTNYILIIIYELSNFDQVLGVVSQTRVSGGNQTHANSTALQIWTFCANKMECQQVQ